MTRRQSIRDHLFKTVLLMLLILAACGKSDWREFRPPDKAFSVLLPAAPRESASSMETKYGRIELKMFRLDDREISYVVGYTDYPGGLLAETSAEEVLRQAGQGAASAVMGTVMSDSAISLAGLEGREFKSQLPDGMGKISSRFFLVGNRLYQVTAFMKSDAVAGNALRFLDSFRPGSRA